MRASPAAHIALRPMWVAREKKRLRPLAGMVIGAFPLSLPDPAGPECRGVFYNGESSPFHLDAGGQKQIANHPVRINLSDDQAIGVI